MGKCLIFSAPSGAGKTTVVRHLLHQRSDLAFSISATSRLPRKGEVEGRDYYFLSAKDFMKKMEDGEFIEWEEVYKTVYYGTLKSEVERIWREGKTVVFDVDVVGGVHLKKYFGEQALSVFIKAPDVATLEARLRGRATESEEELNKRLAKASFEMSFADKFDRVLINDTLADTLKQAESLVQEYLTI